MSVAAITTPTTVGDIMSRPVLTVEVSESLWDAWQLLFVSGHRHLVVLDPDGSCLGVLSDRNVLSEVPATQENLSRLKVSDVLARVPMASTTPLATPTIATQVMTRNTVEALPVLDERGRLAGIVTESDIVRWVASGGH